MNDARKPKSKNKKRRYLSNAAFGAAVATTALLSATGAKADRFSAEGGAAESNSLQYVAIPDADAAVHYRHAAGSKQYHPVVVNAASLPRHVAKVKSATKEAASTVKTLRIHDGNGSTELAIQPKTDGSFHLPTKKLNGNPASYPYGTTKIDAEGKVTQLSLRVSPTVLVKNDGTKIVMHTGGKWVPASSAVEQQYNAAKAKIESDAQPQLALLRKSLPTEPALAQAPAALAQVASSGNPAAVELSTTLEKRADALKAKLQAETARATPAASTAPKVAPVASVTPVSTKRSPDAKKRLLAQLDVLALEARYELQQIVKYEINKQTSLPPLFTGWHLAKKPAPVIAQAATKNPKVKNAQIVVTGNAPAGMLGKIGGIQPGDNPELKGTPNRVVTQEITLKDGKPVAPVAHTIPGAPIPVQVVYYHPNPRNAETTAPVNVQSAVTPIPALSDVHFGADYNSPSAPIANVVLPRDASNKLQMELQSAEDLNLLSPHPKFSFIGKVPSTLESTMSNVRDVVARELGIGVAVENFAAIELPQIIAAISTEREKVAAINTSPGHPTEQQLREHAARDNLQRFNPSYYVGKQARNDGPNGIILGYTTRQQPSGTNALTNFNSQCRQMLQELNRRRYAQANQADWALINKSIDVECSVGAQSLVSSQAKKVAKVTHIFKHAAKHLRHRIANGKSARPHRMRVAEAYRPAPNY